MPGGGGRGRRAALLSGAGVVAVAAMAMLSWNGFFARYNLYRIRHGKPPLGAFRLGAPAINGVVQVVAAREGLVVLSVDREQQVKEGYQFLVHRDDRFQALVKVIKVYDDLAGARILVTSEDGKIKEGDWATLWLERAP